VHRPAADGLAVSGAAVPWRRNPGRAECELSEDCYHVALPSVRSAAGAARHRARGVLESWGAGDAASTVELLTSELVANAVRFSPGAITLTLWRLPGSLVIEVSDQAPCAVPELRKPADDSENGRGLVLVAALSREWSYYFPAPGWKTVYAVIDTRQP
jgi:anti-sigma regulatory factor (Ser/Thr protein kinase)